MGKEEPRKTYQTRPCLRFTIIHGRVYADQSTISTIARDSICHHPEFTPVFTGDNPATTLIPIEHQLFVLLMLDHIFVNDDLAPIWKGDRGISGMNRVPTRSRQTILRRMNRVTGSLTRVIADI